jgi:hypothetical protein
MLGRTLKALIVALSAVIAVKGAEFLTTHVPKLHPLIIVIGCASVAALFNAISEEVVASSKKRVQWIRKQLDPRSRFEGVWIIHVLDLPERPISYSTISYNAEANAYSYRGSSYDMQGSLKVSWVCPKIDFDLAKDEVRVLTETQFVDMQAEGEISRSYGYIQFEKRFFGRTSRYVRGKGFYADFGTKPRKAHFLLDRLDPKRVKSLINKREVITHQDMVELVQAIAKEQKANGTGVIGSPSKTTAAESRTFPFKLLGTLFSKRG